MNDVIVEIRWMEEEKLCHLRKGGDLKKEMKRVLGGVAYMTKSRGPKTEPWGTPQRQVC